MDLHHMSLATGLVSSWLSQANWETLILLYLGPETIMPLGSFLAAAVGILLVFWRQALLICRNTFRKVLGRKPGYSDISQDPEGPGQGQRSPGGD